MTKPPRDELKPVIRSRFTNGGAASSAPALAREFGISPHTIYWWSSQEKWGEKRRQTEHDQLNQRLRLAKRPPAPSPSALDASRSDDLWFTRTWMAP